MEYRMNFLLSLVSGAFTIIIQYFVWTAIYRSGMSGELFGYQYNQMIVYIIMAGILSKVMATGFEWEISADIKKGGLSKFLVQPIQYLPYRMMMFFGQKVIQLFMVSIISFIALNILGFSIGFEFDVKQIGLLVVIIFLSLLMNCLLFYSISALAFWVTEVWAIFIGLGVATNILSGGVFPLDVFGQKAQAVFSLLPFQYVIYFPLNIISSKYSTAEILKGMAIQCIWIVILYVFSKLIWKAGMKKYVAVGG
jgi:ABC-2 type transport system permease protein